MSKKDTAIHCPKCGEIATRYPNQNVYICDGMDCEWEGAPVELKPCPFCGEKPRLSMDGGGDFLVSCKACGVHIHDDMNWKDDDFDAIMNVVGKWNKRTENGG